jgi:hypothetical protein
VLFDEFGELALEDVEGELAPLGVFEAPEGVEAVDGIDGNVVFIELSEAGVRLLYYMFFWVEHCHIHDSSLVNNCSVSKRENLTELCKMKLKV